MLTSWEKFCRMYRHGILTDAELVSAVIRALQDADVPTVVAALPEDYRQLLRQFVQSGSVPWGVYFFNGVTADESRRLRAAVWEHNRGAVEALKAYFDARC